MITVHLQLKQDAQPRFFKPRAVPFAVKPKLEKTLEAMVKEGILGRVDYSRWGIPVVPEVKLDGTVRVCGDLQGDLKHIFRSTTVPITPCGGMLSSNEWWTLLH